MNVVLTTYFSTTTQFSQHDCTEKCKKNQYDIIAKWHQSLHKHKLKGVVFHNELSRSFISEHSSEQCAFQFHECVHRPSYNDERFFCYLEYLQAHTEISKVLMTDAFDVTFCGSPFEIVDSNTLYVGSEHKHAQPAWISKKLRECNLHPPVLQTIYNAGILGGNREIVIKFLELMCSTIKKCPTDVNANMGVLNYLLNSIQSYRAMEHVIAIPRIVTGHPLHNEFRSFSNPQKAYIKHK